MRAEGPHPARDGRLGRSRCASDAGDARVRARLALLLVVRRGALALALAALHEPLVRPEAESLVERVGVARVEDPAAVGVRAVLDRLPHELDAEAVAAMRVEH